MARKSVFTCSVQLQPLRGFRLVRGKFKFCILPLSGFLFSIANVFCRQLVESVDAEPIDTEGQLYRISAPSWSLLGKGRYDI